MCTSMAALVFTIHSQKVTPWCSYISVCLLLLYIVGFGLGLGPCSSIIPNEIFHQDSRPTAISLTNVVHWASNFLVQLTFVFIQASSPDTIQVSYVFSLTLALYFRRPVASFCF